MHHSATHAGPDNESRARSVQAGRLKPAKTVRECIAIAGPTLPSFSAKDQAYWGYCFRCFGCRNRRRDCTLCDLHWLLSCHAFSMSSSKDTQQAAAHARRR